MAGIVVFALATLGISVFFWRLVFNERARHKLLSSRWTFFKLSKEDKKMSDDLQLAQALLAAIVSSFIFVSLIILAIYQLFRPS